MGTANTRTKEERLARVRRNQQNCRDRKRKQVQELQQKVEEMQHERHLQTSGSDLISLSRRVEALTEENTKLREILRGISTLAASATDVPWRDPEQRVSMPTSQPPPPHSLVSQTASADLASSLVSNNPHSQSLWSYELNVDLLSNDVSRGFSDNPRMSNDWFMDFGSGDSFASEYSHWSSHMSSMHTLAPDNASLHLAESPTRKWQPETKADTDRTLCSEADCQTQDQQEVSTSSVFCPTASEAPAVNSETTTLCSAAFQMVFKHNRKHLTSEELNNRLRCGFRQAAIPSQGCRVENRVLFNVLAEICT